MCMYMLYIYNMYAILGFFLCKNSQAMGQEAAQEGEEMGRVVLSTPCPQPTLPGVVEYHPRDGPRAPKAHRGRSTQRHCHATGAGPAWSELSSTPAVEDRTSTAAVGLCDCEVVETPLMNQDESAPLVGVCSINYSRMVSALPTADFARENAGGHRMSKTHVEAILLR